MSPLELKVAGLLPILEQHGSVYLLALVERDDGKSDVVLSSRWSDEQTHDAIRGVAESLVPQLTVEERASLSRVVVFPSSDARVAAFTRATRIEHGTLDVRDSVFFGLEVRRATLFRSISPVEAEPATAVHEDRVKDAE